MKKALIGVMAFLWMFCTEEAIVTVIDVVDLIPLDSEIAGWSRSSAMEVADNDAGLLDLIDGAGQVFMDNGFVKCAFQSYTGTVGSNPAVSLDLRIFDQGDTANVKAAYDAVAVGNEIQWTDAGHAGTEARYLLVDPGGTFLPYYILEFWDENFYAYINIGDGTQAGLNVAQLFANNISNAIHEND
jgi:hypothetical protein